MTLSRMKVEYVQSFGVVRFAVVSGILSVTQKLLTSMDLCYP